MIGGVLGMGRRMAESRMLDSCTVSRPGPKVWDEDAGGYTQTPVVVFSGLCRVKHPTTSGKGADAGSQLVVVSQVEVHLPLAAVGVMTGDMVKITACPMRPEQVGREFTVGSPFDGSQTTALRYRVEVADGR